MCHNERWISYYPVVFHGHTTHAPGYLEGFKNSKKQKKKEWMRNTPPHKEVYLVLSRNQWRLPEDLSTELAEAREIQKQREKR
mmetsp:Transcript_3448/g.11528  ORF Transcript_3448/g.11528 Transcript_3448/m.11528 type:complete len:83 (+) Transcript_3448:342-590(+)